MRNYKICIIGGGKMGQAICRGIIEKKVYLPEEIIITTRTKADAEHLSKFQTAVSLENITAIQASQIIIICVLPQQFNNLMQEIKGSFTAKHTVISIVTGVSIADIRSFTGSSPSVVRVMPNTAINIGQSMTCLVDDQNNQPAAIQSALKIFNAVGKTLIIDESKMSAATALCACGIAFFMRAIRAASQGGIEIGFHAEESLFMAAQTALGAGALLSELGRHPEHEIDNVTSPQGCTIAGLNQMEHSGFSSALIRGITISAEKANNLYKTECKS